MAAFAAAVELKENWLEARLQLIGLLLELEPPPLAEQRLRALGGGPD